jgi:hypothetical protein
VRASVCTLVSGLALLLSACGTGPSEEESERVVNRFQAAVASADGATACAQLTTHLRTEFEKDEGRPCRAAIVGLGLDGLGRAGRTRVYITSALVNVTGGDDAFLDQTPEGWRISAAGCDRTTGPEYDCRLED